MQRYKDKFGQVWIKVFDKAGKPILVKDPVTFGHWHDGQGLAQLKR